MEILLEEDMLIKESFQASMNWIHITRTLWDLGKAESIRTAQRCSFQEAEWIQK